MAAQRLAEAVGAGGAAAAPGNKGLLAGLKMYAAIGNGIYGGRLIADRMRAVSPGGVHPGPGVNRHIPALSQLLAEAQRAAREYLAARDAFDAAAATGQRDAAELEAAALAAGKAMVNADDAWKGLYAKVKLEAAEVSSLGGEATAAAWRKAFKQVNGTERHPGPGVNHLLPGALDLLEQLREAKKQGRAQEEVDKLQAQLREYMDDVLLEAAEVSSLGGEATAAAWRDAFKQVNGTERHPGAGVNHLLPGALDLLEQLREAKQGRAQEEVDKLQAQLREYMDAVLLEAANVSSLGGEATAAAGRDAFDPSYFHRSQGAGVGGVAYEDPGTRECCCNPHCSIRDRCEVGRPVALEQLLAAGLVGPPGAPTKSFAGKLICTPCLDHWEGSAAAKQAAAGGGGRGPAPAPMDVDAEQPAAGPGAPAGAPPPPPPQQQQQQQQQPAHQAQQQQHEAQQQQPERYEWRRPPRRGLAPPLAAAESLPAKRARRPGAKAAAAAAEVEADGR